MEKNLHCNGFIVSLHCQKAIDIRDLSLDDIIETVEYGEIIMSYDDDTPYPSKLILKFVNNIPLHVVVSQDPNSLQCILITAYEPDKDLWQPDFKSKIKY